MGRAALSETKGPLSLFHLSALTRALTKCGVRREPARKKIEKKIFFQNFSKSKKFFFSIFGLICSRHALAPGEVHQEQKRSKIEKKNFFFGLRKNFEKNFLSQLFFVAGLWFTPNLR